MEIMGMTHSWSDLSKWKAHSSLNYIFIFLCVYYVVYFIIFPLIYFIFLKIVLC